MRLRPFATFVIAMTLLAGCAATVDQKGLEQRTAQAIGRPVGQFDISDRTEEAGGRINYTVNTREGRTFRCYMYGATGLQKAVTFGQTPHSDAICTAMAGGQGRGTSQPPAACNALMKAAGRC